MQENQKISKPKTTKYRVIIGLEVYVSAETAQKAFDQAFMAVQKPGLLGGQFALTNSAVYLDKE
jgi:hypothetical protein